MIKKIVVKINKPLQPNDPLAKSIIKKQELTKAIQEGVSTDELIKRGLIKE